MAKKTVPTPTPANPASQDNPAGAVDRDLVQFFSRLTHSLENAHGRDALARRLAELRGSPPADTTLPVSSLSRMFRRLGYIGHDSDVGKFTDDFAGQVGEAVSRPPEYILLLLRLFVDGDDDREGKPICGPTPQCQTCQLTKDCDHFNNPRKPEMAALSPAARLMAGNDRALSDAELLALILYGEKGTGMEPVVATLLARYGRLRAVFRADGHEYASIRGMSSAHALRLAATGLLHRRLLAERRDEMLRITCAQDIHDRYAAELRDYRIEAAVLLIMDQQNQVMRDVWFCDGAPNMAQVGIAELLRPAIREYAVRVAFVHNHPGNNAQPSLSDLDFTRRLRAACDVMGLDLVDHVIVAESGYYSFAENGMLRG